MRSTIDFLEQDYKIDESINRYNDKNEISRFLNQKSENVKKEYIEQIKRIHSILLDCPSLNHVDKLIYCNNQRFFMKLYLKELVFTKIKC